MTTIQAAAQTGQVSIAEYLLAAAADPTAGNGSTTPLHGAILFAQEGMVDWLLKHGAKPDLKNYEGKTPLELAMADGKFYLT